MHSVATSSLQSWDKQAILDLKEFLHGRATGIRAHLCRTVAITTGNMMQLVMHLSTQPPQLIDRASVSAFPVQHKGFLYGTLLVRASAIQTDAHLSHEHAACVAAACIEVVLFLETAAWMQFCRNHQVIQAHKRVTTAERQVLLFIQQGYSNAEMARLLDVQEHTLKTHKRNLYQKLGAHRESQALAAGREAGLFLYLS